MQRITVDLIRLAVTGAVALAVVLAANPGGLNHRGQFVSAAFHIPMPILVNAISIAAPPMCWAANDQIGAPATTEAQAERGAIVQSCASVAPALRSHRELAPQSLLALAP
jgi:hypothetical protein